MPLQVQQLANDNKFENEIKAEQEKKKKELQEAKERREAFKQKAATFQWNIFNVMQRFHIFSSLLFLFLKINNANNAFVWVMKKFLIC